MLALFCDRPRRHRAAHHRRGDRGHGHLRPGSDNAQGIAEMSGDVEARARRSSPTPTPSATMTKAITKAPPSPPPCSPRPRLSAPYRRHRDLRSPAGREGHGDEPVHGHLPAQQPVRDGARCRRRLPVLRSPPSTPCPGRPARSSSRGAAAVPRPPGIMNYTETPEYGRVVDIRTKDAARTRHARCSPSSRPIAVGFTLGRRACLVLPGPSPPARRWPSSSPTRVAPGTTRRSWSRTGTTAARAARRMRPRSSATRSATRSYDTAGPGGSTRC